MHASVPIPRTAIRKLIAWLALVVKEKPSEKQADSQQEDYNPCDHVRLALLTMIMLQRLVSRPLCPQPKKMHQTAVSG
jgi:hypothetical protein